MVRADIAVALVIAAALAGCTYDLELGSRPCGSNTDDNCTCTDTSDCPDHFYCMPDNNNAGGGRTCTPPVGCTVNNAGTLECPDDGCSPDTDPNCIPEETCANNVCPDNTACCPSDNLCYPATCAGCCGSQ